MSQPNVSSDCLTWNPKRGIVPKKQYDRPGAIDAARGCETDIGVPFSAYRCTTCPHWHVGKSPARRRCPHADEARLLEIGDRGVKAESDENEMGHRRAEGVIRGRVFHARALAAGKANDRFRKKERRTDHQRFMNLMTAVGYHHWTRP